MESLPVLTTPPSPNSTTLPPPYSTTLPPPNSTILSPPDLATLPPPNSTTLQHPNSTIPNMTLPSELIYSSREALFKAIQNWAKPCGYAFTTGKSKRMEGSGR